MGVYAFHTNFEILSGQVPDVLQKNKLAFNFMNFFHYVTTTSFAPYFHIGVATMNEGVFDVLRAQDLISPDADPNTVDKYLTALESFECVGGLDPKARTLFAEPKMALI